MVKPKHKLFIRRRSISLNVALFSGLYFRTLWTVITSKVTRSKLSFAGNLSGKVNKLEWLWRQELIDVYTDKAKTFYRNCIFVTWARLFSRTFFFNIVYNHYVAPGKNVGAERILLAGGRYYLQSVKKQTEFLCLQCAGRFCRVWL